MTTGIQTPQEAIAAASAGGAKIVDIRFTDLFGIWQHFSIPAREFTPELFDEGDLFLQPGDNALGGDIGEALDCGDLLGGQFLELLDGDNAF
ncbi:MAG: glutamine synthetase, partial [Anaerolineales bacterium]|nr:glutamine synthetase [Anaerolineales bacterium]